MENINVMYFGLLMVLIFVRCLYFFIKIGIGEERGVGSEFVFYIFVF